MRIKLCKLTREIAAFYSCQKFYHVHWYVLKTSSNSGFEKLGLLLTGCDAIKIESLTNKGVLNKNFGKIPGRAL